jgi:hypothetical protein
VHLVGYLKRNSTKWHRNVTWKYKRVQNEMGGACNTYGGEKCLQGFGGETWGGKKLLDDPGEDGRIILTWICRKQDGGGIDWIDLTQDRDR